MANAFSLKSTLATGRSLVMDAAPPNAMTLNSLVLSGDNSVEWEIYIDRDISTLAVGAVSLSDASTGGTIGPNVTVYVRVTAVDANGKESPPSAAVSRKTGSGTTNKITATWTAVVDAVSYKIYTSTKAGQESRYSAAAVSPQGISEPPVNIPLAVPTTPDIHALASIGLQNISVLGTPLNERIVVYAKVGSSTTVTISVLAQ